MWRGAVLTLAFVAAVARSQCPWSREMTDLHTDCVCSFNSVQRLSVQCSPVNFTRLMSTLHTSVERLPIDLLYVNNSTVEALEGPIFLNLDVKSLHLSQCGIKKVADDVFTGLERTLVSLSLQENKLSSVPAEALARLSNLKELDLSHNEITTIPSGVFVGLPLSTLKLADNMPLNISEGAFRGLESSLKNLNLKGAGLEVLPTAVRNLGSLTYLDLAQNKLAELPEGALAELHSLSVLNLERNRILQVSPVAFRGVNDTLNSLSLLNNLLLEFPGPALAVLSEIRVLDLGFNGIRILPDDGFRNNQYLALLALDGNPLATVPEAAFAHLNSTLRGLSLGGSYLECDCKLRWILEWMKRYELQVTSRERNPQFCSQPEHLRRRTFAQLSVSDLTCQDSTPIPTGPTKGPKRLDEPEIPPPQKVPDVSPPTRVISTTSSSPGTTMKMFEEIRMLDAKVQDSSIAVQWEADSSNLLGFLVIYRRFGEPEFRHGPGIDKNHRRFILENLPPNECIVVCVVTLEDSSNLSAGAVPYGQCREVRTPGSRVDTLVIAASAAVCVVVVIAILAVLCCMRSRKSSPAVPPPPPLKAEPAEWETSSVYSTRSIPRAKMYHHDGSFLVDDNRSHISHYSQAPNGYRSTADGQSHRSYSQFSNRFTLGHPEIRKSQQSLSQVSGHHSFMSAPRPGHAAAKNGRLTSASSLHSLSEYNDWHRKGYGGPR